MKTVYQGQTYRLKIRAINQSDRTPIDLTGATAVGKIDLNPGVQSFPAVIDTGEGSITLTIDRTVTALWRTGKYDIQIWVDFGEDAPVEADVFYAASFTVERGF